MRVDNKLVVARWRGGDGLGLMLAYSVWLEGGGGCLLGLFWRILWANTAASRAYFGYKSCG